MYRIIEVTDYKGSLPRHWYMGDKVMFMTKWIFWFQMYPMAFDVQCSEGEFQ